MNRFEIPDIFRSGIDVREGAGVLHCAGCEAPANKGFSISSSYRQLKGRNFKPESERNS